MKMRSHGRGICFTFLATALVVATVGGTDTASSSAEEVQLQAIGSLAAAHIYTSYGYVGVTADGLVAKTFTAKQVIELMSEVDDMLTMNMEALQKVSSSVSGDDRQFVDDLINIYQMVKKETMALTTYARTEKAEDAAAFEKSRKSIWPYLKQTLGIE